MKKILITRGVFPEVVETLAKHFEVEHNADDRPWLPEGARQAPARQGREPSIPVNSIPAQAGIQARSER